MGYAPTPAALSDAPALEAMSNALDPAALSDAPTLEAMSDAPTLEAMSDAPALCIKFILEGGEEVKGIRPVLEDLSADTLYIFARADTGYPNVVLYADAHLEDEITDDESICRLVVDNRHVAKENDFIEDQTGGKISPFQCYEVYVRVLPEGDPAVA
ncbi:hypothetical protein LPJ61_003716 [Coemansia biformis]|uniref:Uncharacterized protein n=1 Tax=Coemansia biformis TaxID=1286918 RepID=A0A9W8CVB9_9FUNG|nr:hypothetical protein LPJ61_003716 [Coemansia biformis]